MNADENSDSNDGSPTISSSKSSGSHSTTRSGASLIGCRLGDYQVLRKLGKGGMADVYAARHLSLGRDVAIKVLRSDYAKDKDYISRFRREARAAAKLNHSSIVQVYDVGSVDQTHFIAQELIKGQNLKEVLTNGGPLTAEEATKVLVAVGYALEAAAEVGITHRDIKPENIMRSSRGDIKVADFGLARLGFDTEASRSDLTQAGLTMGTPRYMSPEQVQGKVVDVRSDLYSLGVSMYHLLSGRPPFEADDPLALAVLHLHETPQPLDRTRGKDDLPEWMIAVISRLMSKLPEDRFQSPSELLSAVSSQSSFASDKAYGAIGTAAATIRLQRATDAAVIERRQGYLRWAIAIAIPLVCGATALAMSLRTPPINVAELLKPPLSVKADSVEEQYLVAVARNDVASWTAISNHFPPNGSSKNRSYFAKSMVQLSRLYANQDKNDEALTALDRLLSDPKIDRKYRLVATAARVSTLESMNNPNELQLSLSRLKSLYKDLKKNSPSSIEFFNRVVPPEERMQLEIGVSSSRDT